MKKIISLALLISFFSFIACKKDDTTKENSLLGKWTLARSYVSPGHIVDWQIYPKGDNILQINMDKTMSVHDKTQSGILPQGSGSYSIAAENLIAFNSNNGNHVELSYKINKDTLSLYSMNCREGCIWQYVRF